MFSATDQWCFSQYTCFGIPRKGMRSIRFSVLNIKDGVQDGLGNIRKFPLFQCFLPEINGVLAKMYYVGVLRKGMRSI